MSDKVELNSEAGKQQVDALLAKMSPEQQVEFKAALAADKPVHVHMGKDGTISLGDAAVAAAAAASNEPPPQPASEDPVELKREDPKKPSKLDQKRQQILQDRLKRHMGRGLTQQQAFQAMQREDYEAMPIDKKFARLENIVSQSFQNLAQEIMGLNQSHISIADAFDINYRATQKLFTKLGVSNEDQKALIEESQKEVIADKQKAQEAQNKARMDQMRAQQDAAELKRVEELKKTDSSLSNGAHVEGAEVPKEATVFGG